MPYLIIILIAAILLTLFGLFFSYNRGRRLLKKKSSYSIQYQVPINKQEFNKIMLELVSKFHYNLQLAMLNDNKVLVTDGYGVWSWGFYYLVEFKTDEIEISLFPRYPFEFNQLGLFNRRLERIQSHIELIRVSR